MHLNIWESGLPAGLDESMDLNAIVSNAFDAVLSSEEYERALLVGTQSQFGEDLKTIGLFKGNKGLKELSLAAWYGRRFIKVELGLAGIKNLYVDVGFLQAVSTNRVESFIAGCGSEVLILEVNTDFFTTYGQILTYLDMAYETRVFYLLNEKGEDIESFCDEDKIGSILMHTKTAVSDDMVEFVHSILQKHMGIVIGKGSKGDIGVTEHPGEVELIEALNWCKQYHQIEHLTVYVTNTPEKESVLGFIKRYIDYINENSYYFERCGKITFDMTYHAVNQKDIIGVLYTDYFIESTEYMCADLNLSFVLHIDKSKYRRSIEALRDAFDNGIMCIVDLE